MTPYSRYSDFSIPKLRLIVNGYQLESGWLEIGQILKVLNTRAKQDKYREILTEIAISDRTASYLVAIVTRLDSQGIQVPQDIGWRKMAEVAPVLTYENRIIIFNKVRSHTREELIKMRQEGSLTKEEQ